MRKRLFDAGLSALLLLLLTPLFVLIALCIKLDSRGPVFFRQTRVGRFGTHFRVIKFRTMRVDFGNCAPPITIGNDPRITRVGALLRRHKLDELPQFVNVLLGQMSIVGPRPEIPKYVAMYPAPIRDIVLSVRPGITDPASIEFKSESETLARSPNPERTYVEEIMPAKLRLGVAYVSQMSFWQDVAIVFRTIRALLTRREHG